jgi:hypothetical protein
MTESFSARDYARALRVIGSALEALDVEAFELTCEASNYVVRIQSQRRTKAQAKGLAWNILQRISRRHSPGGANPETLELIYTLEDIESLDHNGQLKRQEGGKSDAHSLPQALRAIGAYLQIKEGRLHRLFKNSPLVTIEYETAQGDHTFEEFTAASLYELFVWLYIKRGDRVKPVTLPSHQSLV